MTIDLVVLSKRIIMLTREFEETPPYQKKEGGGMTWWQKINRGASLYGAVIYNQQKVNESTARIISGNRMIADVTGNPEQVMRNTLWAFEITCFAQQEHGEAGATHIAQSFGG